MRRPVKLALLAVGFLALLGGLLLWSLLRRGFSTHDEPSRIEAWAARSARHWSTPADLRGTRNPLPLTPQVLAEARAHWADHCASCHDGRQQERGQGQSRRRAGETSEVTARMWKK